MTDNSLTFQEFRTANLNRALSAEAFSHCRDWIPAQWMNALIGEIGEAANIIKKVDRGDVSMDEVREKLAKEFADAQTYLDLVAVRCGIDLGESTRSKFNEVSDRIGSGVKL